MTTHEAREVERGTQFWWKGGLAKVMAVADGYVMARKPGMSPFVVSLKEVAAALRETPDDNA